MLTVFVAVVADSPDDVDKTSTTVSTTDITRWSDEQSQRMLVWARANPGGRRPAPAPPLPRSVQLVGVDVRRIQRKTRVTSDDDDDNARRNSTNQASNEDTALTDQLRLNRIRRKNFRLLTILKNINDRIGRGASPPPPRMRDEAVERVPRRNTSSSECESSWSADDCNDQPMTVSSQTAADDVHVVAQSCARADAVPTDEAVGRDAGVGSGDDGVWLEFRELNTLTHCHSAVTRRDQIRRSKLVVYVRGNDADSGKRKSLSPRRMRRRQLKRSLKEKFGVSFESWHRRRRQRNGNVLLLSVYQEITVNRRRQRKKLKLIGKRRVRRLFSSGWLRINVQPRLTACRRRRRHRLMPLALLLRVSDLARSTAGDVRQLVSMPVECDSTTQLDTDDRLETSTTPQLRENGGNMTSTQSQQPYLELSVNLPATSEQRQHRLHRSQRSHSAADQ